MKILLVSSSAGNLGHGLKYLEMLHFHLSKEENVSIFVPNDVDLPKTLQIEQVKSPVSFAFTSREKYLRFGSLAQLVRGFDRLKYGILFFKTLISHVKNENYDIVHILDSEYISLIYCLNKAKQVRNSKFVITIHASDFGFENLTISTIYKSTIAFFLKKSFNNVIGVVCHGEWIKKRLLKTFPNIKGKIVAFDYPSSSYNDYGKTITEDLFDKYGDSRIVLFIGMIRKDKRIELALDTIQQLPNNYKLLIAGSLSDYTIAEIEKLIDDRGIGSKVETVFKYLTNEEFETYFRLGDVFLSTHSDKFPSASGPVADSRTYGLPVVVAKGGQLEEYVNREKVGLVAQESTAVGFSNSVLEVVENISFFKRNVINASNKFSWESFGKVHLALYKKNFSNEDK